MEKTEFRKNNTLLNAKAQWNVQEQKIFNILLASLNEDKKTELFTLSRASLEEILGSELQSTQLKKLANSMASKIFTRKDDSDNWEVLTIFKSIKYSRGTLTLRINDMAMKDLYEMKSFTRLILEDLVSFDSKYSIRIYELLKRERFKGMKPFTVSLDELKEFLWCQPGEYKDFRNFESRVLKVAEKEINGRSSLKYKYEKIKEWRTVTAIKFIYIDNREESIKIPAYLNFKELSQKQREALLKLGIQKTIEINERNSWSIVPEEYIRMQLSKTAASDYRDFYAYLSGSLREDWAGFEVSKMEENEQISILDIAPPQVNKKKSRASKAKQQRMAKKDFKEREYDFDALERKLLGWD